MNSDYDAIVVGGGLAGLTSAAYLCRYGYRTLLCEKASKTGGLVSTFWHRNYAFDAGLRACENSGIVFPMIKSLGLDIQFVHNPVVMIVADQRQELSAQDSLPNYAAMLTALFPDNAADIARIAQEIRHVMNLMDVLYGIDNPLFLDDMRDRTYLVKTLLPWLFKYQMSMVRVNRLQRPVNNHLKRFTSNQSLIDMITQHFFHGTPAFFALSYFGLYLDYCYPMGGTGVIPEKVSQYVLDTGGEIRTDAAVTQVDTRQKRVQTANGDTFGYKKVVWAADQRALYTAVSDVNTSQFQTQSQLVQQSAGNDSVLTVFYGIDLARDYFAHCCGAHAFYTPSTQGLSSLPSWRELDASALWAWLERYLELTTYEISCPALRDPSLAEAGKTGVIISTLLEYHLVQRILTTIGYDDFKELCTQQVTKVLGSSLFPGFADHIEFARCATPLMLERQTSNTHGAITGWAFTNVQIPAVSQFKKITQAIKTPIPDVYQCGQWTFSPSGMPVSILTGKLAADAVHKTLQVNRQ